MNVNDKMDGGFQAPLNIPKQARAEEQIGKLKPPPVPPRHGRAPAESHTVGAIKKTNVMGPVHRGAGKASGQAQVSISSQAAISEIKESAKLALHTINTDPNPAAQKIALASLKELKKELQEASLGSDADAVRGELKAQIKEAKGAIAQTERDIKFFQDTKAEFSKERAKFIQNPTVEGFATLRTAVNMFSSIVEQKGSSPIKGELEKLRIDMRADLNQLDIDFSKAELTKLQPLEAKITKDLGDLKNISSAKKGKHIEQETKKFNVIHALAQDREELDKLSKKLFTTTAAVEINSFRVRIDKAIGTNSSGS